MLVCYLIIIQRRGGATAGGRAAGSQKSLTEVIESLVDLICQHSDAGDYILNSNYII